jgi:hypothetical protein
MRACEILIYSMALYPPGLMLDYPISRMINKADVESPHLIDRLA